MDIDNYDESEDTPMIDMSTQPRHRSSTRQQTAPAARIDMRSTIHSNQFHNTPMMPSSFKPSPTKPSLQPTSSLPPDVSHKLTQLSKLTECEEDKALIECLDTLDDFIPLIPDSLMDHLMTKNGIDPEGTHPKLKKLVALMSQKWLTDVAQDALQFCKLRQGAISGSSKKEKRFVLTLEDLACALKEQGIKVNKPPYYR